MQTIDAASAERLELERGAILSCDMWQVPRVLWTQWCNVMIDAWESLLPVATSFDANHDPRVVPSSAVPSEQER
jgi:hypothetical protein